ncbi:DNA binding methylated-DNA--cysteine S-methyltransferase [Auricularia subglabra TFB-10046 SS5]|nr:DNA binding methylated-DNA--cysteine S-methyltransferase [Auricularia subglabra TFB-10046 SS5]
MKQDAEERKPSLLEEMADLARAERKRALAAKKADPSNRSDVKAKDMSICNVYYPATSAERLQYRTPEGKALTAFQWAVYDVARTIPSGRVLTYKGLCERLKQGSPRSIGGALRHNPFAPFVPCHRIIASDFSLGGFCGKWQSGKEADNKLALLAAEGVHFDSKKRLRNHETVWRD